MNYRNRYLLIIENSKLRTPLIEYTEKHHILPKSLGGSNDTTNIALLTAREHFVCHLLLAKIYGGSMWYAAWRMSNRKKYSSRKYEWIKVNFGKLVSSKFKGIPRTEEVKKKISISHTGKKRSPFSETARRNISLSRKGKIRGPHTDERRKNIGLSRKGSRLSDETRARMSSAHRKPFTAEHKRNISKSKTKVQII